MLAYAADATPTHRTPLPPVTCVPWCERADGHPNEIFLGDQVCMSRSERVPVGFHGAGIETYALGTATGEALVTVSAEHAGGCVELNLTIEQAERHAAALRRTIALARHHRTVTR